MILPSQCFCQEDSLSLNLFSFERIMSEDGTVEWAFGDFDGDGTEEVARTDGKGVTVSDFIGSSLRTTADLVGRLTVVRLLAQDVNGDLFPEILIGILKDNNVWTEVWTCSSSGGKNTYSRLLKTAHVTVSDLNGDGRWDGDIANYQLIQVNNDEYLDLLTLFITGYDLYPRGVMAFDGKTGRKLWYFPTAGHSNIQSCEDLNDDGEREIIIGDRAPCNGNRVKR